jgi:UDP-N-acetylglucosamine--N-acetylmuramyl-(pentapeptide) pyrophosphoryl-undecaprenol N-acetylglucosamine transferase
MRERRSAPKVLIAAGGSGGHIFPAIALAKALKEKDKGISIKFVGGNRDLDRRIFTKERFDFTLISANKLPYGFSWKIPLFFIRLFLDILRSLSIMASYNPDIVVGFGGYVSFPVIFASYIFRKRSIVHEQNAVPGRANSFLFRFADRIAISFDETRDLVGGNARKVVRTGNPLRPEMFRDDKELSTSLMGLKKGVFTVLVIGGSQGAHFLNETVISGITKMDELVRKNIQVIHITGVKDYEWARARYEAVPGLEHRVYSFIDRIEEAYSASDLIVSRSGASALSEMAVFGRPMILVPYPFAMSHQAENARVFSKRGAAIEIEEKALSGDVMRDTIQSLLNDRTQLNSLGEAARRMAEPAASYNLADEVLGFVR